MLKQAETLSDSPEELLRFCEVEMHRLRARSKRTSQHRAAVVAVSLLVVVIGGMAAFFLLFSRLQDLRSSRPEVTVSAAGSR